jgi:hypothetical protein
MVKLSDALGALLKEIAQSRIQSDLFSKEVSREYSQDPFLKLFPVPRVEIRSLDLELAFAVAEAKQKDVKISEIVQPLLLQSVPDLRKRVLNIRATLARTTRQSETIISLLKEKQAQVENELDRRLETVVKENIGKLSEQILQDTEKFIETMSLEAVRIVSEIVVAKKINLAFGAQFQKDVREKVSEWSNAVSETVRSSVDRSKADSFTLDITLTKDELANVPVNAVSRVKLSVEMRNIELIQTEDVEGQAVHKPIVS